MNLKRSFLTTMLIGITTLLQAQPYAYNPYDENQAESCTSIMVGKKASTDGSVMTAHTCDSNYRTWLSMEKRKSYKASDTQPIYWGALHTEEPHDIRGLKEKGRIPAKEGETFSFLNVAYPCLNEKQLAIGETTTVGKRFLKDTSGLFLIEELERIALERCSTAREAIKLIGSLAEEFGYADNGECLTIADKNEVWHFEIYGTNFPGKDTPAEKGKKKKTSKFNKPGALWVAQRIPDDHVGISANIPRIGVVNFNDTCNFMYSSDLKERTIHMGLWDGKSEFKFYKMVSDDKPFSVREYFVLSTLAPSLNLSYDADELPFSVKPDKKVSPETMFALYRQTYEGTEFDQVKGMNVVVDRRVRQHNGEYINFKDTVCPVSAFMPNDLRALFNQIKKDSAPRIRTIAVIQCSYSHIIQLRDWLPDEIGGVAYFAFDNPAQTPRIPIYCGEDRLPNGFDVCGQHRYREDAAIWSYRETNRIATINWDKTRHLLEPLVLDYEKLMMEKCKKVEAEAAALIKEGKKETAVKMLNEFTRRFEASTRNSWEELKRELWPIFARGM